MGLKIGGLIKVGWKSQIKLPELSPTSSPVYPEVAGDWIWHFPKCGEKYTLKKPALAPQEGFFPP